MAEKVVSLSRDSWMPNDMARACFKCEKSFGSFRRRHHCRYCGLLFCAKCSKVNVELKDGVKLERTCEKCLGVLEQPEFKISHQLAQYPYFPKDNSVFVDEEGEEVVEEEANIDLQQFFNEEDLNNDECNQGEIIGAEELEHYLISRCKEFSKEINAVDWEDCLASSVRDAIKNIKPTKNDKMNLSKYVRVTNFPVEDKCRYFKGIAFKKVLASKKMSSKISNPKILILSGSIGFFLCEKNIISMNRLINQEENYTKIMMDLIKNMIKPDLIIVEKAMPFTIITELAAIGVSVLMNVKLKLLKLIARLTGGRILSSINQSLYQNSGYLGTCVEFWQHKIGNEVYSFFQAAPGFNLSGTILFKSGDLDKKVLKHFIMKLVIQYWSVVLEKALLSLFGVLSVNYEDFYSSSTSFIHVSTCRNKICSRPKIHQIEFYSKQGKTLGDFLKYNLKNSLQGCENCGKQLFLHKFYYFKSRGRVKISFSKEDEKLTTLQVYRYCTKCQCKSTTTKLIDMAWRFSFNKYIENFFFDGEIKHEVCSHDFYKDGRFMFGLLDYRVVIEYEKTEKLKLFHMPEYSDEIIGTIMSDNYNKLIVAGEKLLLQLKSIKNYIFNVGLAFTSENSTQDTAVIVQSIGNIENSFNSVEIVFEEIKIVNPVSYLHVEALRRKFFFLVCKIIIELENGTDIIEKVDARKGLDPLALKELHAPEDVYNDLPSLLISLSEKFNITSNKEFSFLQRGCLTFPIKDSSVCIPIDEEDSLSIIAYALNSSEYQDEINDLFENAEEISEIIESELLSAKEEHFSFSETNYSDEEFSTEQERESFRRIYGDSMSIKVTAYFHKQFHGMRHLKIGSHQDYLLSISSAQTEALHLGKSKAYFKHSVDERYIIKIIGERQFRMFMDFAPNYFRHCCKSLCHGMPSCLVKILGAYNIQVRNHSTGHVRQEWLLVNDNLMYQLPKDSLVYDLKGTVNKRRKVQEGDARTKMDLNYVEFMDGLPIVLEPDVKKKLDAEIWNDTLFLSQQNIVDYSMLLVLNLNLKMFTYGIIDYMEQYTFERAIESKYKLVVGTEVPTIIYPKDYKNRFRQHLIQIYFMSVE